MDIGTMEELLQSHPNDYKDNFIEQLTKNITHDAGTKYLNYCTSRRLSKHKTDSHRNGPAPVEESEHLRKSIAKATYGTLDSDLEDLDFEDIRIKNANITNAYNRVRATRDDYGHNLASCRALIVYFSKLAKTKDDDEMIDLNFVESLLDNGADINFPDKHGQTVLHEISRGWHPDVAKFAIEHGADINKPDLFGRTPLHLAAAVDYDDMVQFLVENGANLGASTNGENQTPMHYAAKNNATASLKVMLQMGGRINDRDYKRRTPLFVAAETARSEAARFLIEKGAPAGVYDSSGTPCLSLMIEKMPQIAIEAIEQFHSRDLAFRKHYYYLSFLEKDPNYLIEYIPEKKSEQKELKERKKAERKLSKQTGQRIIKREKSYAKTPLEVIVQYNQLDLIMHPVFQRLLHVKWQLFGKWGSAKLLGLNLFYTLIWTILGIMVPRGEAAYYTPIKEKWWSMVMEAMGVGLTIYFIFKEIYQLRNTEKSYNCWRQWRSRHMEKDLKFCHPRWPEEEQYLRSELAQIKSYQRTYFRDPWNIFEWIAYLVVMVLVFTRILTVSSGDETAKDVHMKFYAIGLIVIWLRFMRSCRVFRTLGPFIAILGSVIADTMKFAFLFFEFFVPYSVAFWILFGGPVNAEKMGENSVNWEYFSDMAFSVFTMTILGPFDFEGLLKVDRLMAQVLCGTYFALAGVVCMNLYIALLSDTFARVYAQAKANAVMQQALCIITLESKLNKFYRSKYGHFMQRECSPQEVYMRDEKHDDGDDDDYKFDRVTRQIINRINEMDDNMTRHRRRLPYNEQNNSEIVNYYGDGGPPSRGGRESYSGDKGLYPPRQSGMDVFFDHQSQHNSTIRRDIEMLKHSLKRIEIMISQSNNSGLKDSFRNPIGDLPNQETFSSTSTNKTMSVKSASSNVERSRNLLRGGSDTKYDTIPRIKSAAPSRTSSNVNIAQHTRQLSLQSNPNQTSNNNLSRNNTTTSSDPKVKPWLQSQQGSIDSDSDSDTSTSFSDSPAGFKKKRSSSKRSKQSSKAGSQASLNVLQNEIEQIENRKRELLLQKQKINDVIQRENIQQRPNNPSPSNYPPPQQSYAYPPRKSLEPPRQSTTPKSMTPYPPQKAPQTPIGFEQIENDQQISQTLHQRTIENRSPMPAAYPSTSPPHMMDRQPIDTTTRRQTIQRKNSLQHSDTNISSKSESMQSLGQTVSNGNIPQQPTNDNDAEQLYRRQQRRQRRRKKTASTASDGPLIGEHENNIPLQNLHQSIQQYEQQIAPQGVPNSINSVSYNGNRRPYENTPQYSNNIRDERSFYRPDDVTNVYVQQPQHQPFSMYPPTNDYPRT